MFKTFFGSYGFILTIKYGEKQSEEIGAPGEPPRPRFGFSLSGMLGVSSNGNLGGSRRTTEDYFLNQMSVLMA